MRNLSNDSARFELNLKTDYNWEANECDINVVISKNQAHAIKLLIKKKYFIGLDSLIFQLHMNDYETTIDISGANIEYDFIPPLVGKQHHAIINSLKSLIQSNTKGINIYYLLGSAWVGKTRITDELRTLFLNQNIIAGYCICTKNRYKIYSKLVEDLNIKDKLNEPISSLHNLILKCDSEYDKYLIILDDLHNASSDIFSELYTLLNTKTENSISILMIGRNDYSGGDNDYYTFIEFCKNNLNGSFLNPMTEEDSKNLIRAIIKDVPSSILNKVYKLSNNIPLYIIQYIEYLLDLKLVYLKNRATIGVENVDNISEHTYMPQKIEDIYRHRLKNLELLDDGDQLKELLLVLTLWDISFSKDLLLNYLPDGRLINQLINRYFLKYTKNGDLAFAHESIFMFLKKYLNDDTNLRTAIVKKFMKNMSRIFSSKSLLEQGQMYAWIGDDINSKNCFGDIIPEFSNIDNYSSIRVNSNYYEYLYTIYDVLERNNENKTVLKNILMYRVYLSLHYHTPFNAISDCIKIEKKILNGSILNMDRAFKLLLLEQKAHAFINIGNLRAGETLLQKLLTEVIIDANSLDKETQFDMYDKFTNVYIKYNNLELAQKYNGLSFKIAEECGDLKLLALAEISKAKLLSYLNPSESYTALYNARKYLLADKEERIYCHNEISILVMDIRKAYEKGDSLHGYIKSIYSLLKQSIDGGFANSIIRCHLLLASVYLLERKNNDDLKMVIKHASDGIDASVNFGIGIYMWHFYNIKAIVSKSLHENDEKVNQYFETVFRILKRQNLLFLGECDFTYENIIALTNVALYYKNTKFESRYYHKLSQISTNHTINSCDYNCSDIQCNYVCNKSIDSLKQQYLNTNNNNLLFVSNKKCKYRILDADTGYYVFFA